MKVRIEMHLSEIETKLLDTIAKIQSRSRKNLCEMEMQKFIQAFSFLTSDKNHKSLKPKAFPDFFGNEFSPL